MRQINAVRRAREEPQRDPSQLVSFGIRLDDADSPADTIDALALSAFLVGEQPFAVTENLARVRTGAPLLPDGAAPLRVATRDKEADAPGPR